MMIKTFGLRMITVAAITLGSACGGGGGGGSANNPQPPVSKITVSGVASKGLIKNGTINIYAANGNGTNGSLLATATTDAQGHYAVDIANYTGPVIIEATGNYTDEATGQTRAIDTSSPLHAVLPALSGTSVGATVTPFTDLAYRKAQAAIAANTDLVTSITTSNTQVSNLFNVNITTIQPVEPTQSALQGATPEQQRYTLALAAISQMAKDNALSVAGVVNNLDASGATAPAMVSGSLNTFLASNSNNSTGYKTLNISVSLAGVTTTQVGSIDFTIDFPAGVTLPSDTTGAVPPCNFTVTATGATNTVTAITKLTSGTGSTARLRVIILDTNLLSNGQFAILKCPVSIPTQTTNFSVESGVTGKDANGITVSGIGVVLQ
ncbi:hypothetical protein GMSM_44320 [Geomonas sp. Red276]